MVVWSVLVLAVAVLAKAAIPDPPDTDASAAGNTRSSTATDCSGIVAFSAIHGINDNSRVVHAELLVQKGDSYSTRTGVFIGLCPGLYQFSFAGYGSTDLRLTLKRKLAKNGSWRPIVSVGPGGGANTILLEVNVGDQLAVYVESGKITDGATFTGYRIDSRR